jgi:hypothetical protein
MADDPNTARLDWGYRLLLVAIVALWVVYPPHKASPSLNPPERITAEIKL